MGQLAEYHRNYQFTEVEVNWCIHFYDLHLQLLIYRTFGIFLMQALSNFSNMDCWTASR